MMTYIYISVNLMNDLGYSTILFWLFEVCEGPVAATASGPTIVTYFSLFDSYSTLSFFCNIPSLCCRMSPTNIFEAE